LSSRKRRLEKEKETKGQRVVNSVYRKTTGAKINSLLDRELWAGARRLIEREIAKISPADFSRHWLLARLSTTYYEEKQYEEALKIAKQAEQIAPNCPLVLWDLAGTYSMLNDNASAISIYTRLIERGVNRIARDQCGEGRQWAGSLIADCWYRLGTCYRDAGNIEKAIDCWSKHFEMVVKGADSIYSYPEVLHDIIEGAPHNEVHTNGGPRGRRAKQPARA
jgi:tetratricopeptide (TPR) repeat protein